MVILTPKDYLEPFASHLHSHRNKSPAVLFYEWVRGLDNLKTATKGTGVTRNVFPKENATKCMNGKRLLKFKLNIVTNNKHKTITGL